MGKAVLISIQPKWCELIASGKKTIEVRKTKPKLETPFKVYIYCTKGKFALLRKNNEYRHDHWDFAEFHKSCENEILNGKVIGEFVCDGIYYFGNLSTDPWNHLVGSTFEYFKTMITKDALLSEDEIRSYGGKYGWHISDLVIYDNPRELSEFAKPIDCHRGNERESCIGCWDCEITRPPQSWCYVEEVQR